MTTDQKIFALVRVLELVFQSVGGFLPSNVQEEIRRTFIALKTSNESKGGNRK